MELNFEDASIRSVIAVDEKAEVRVEEPLSAKVGTHPADILLVGDLDFEENADLVALTIVQLFVVKLPVRDVDIQQPYLGLQESRRLSFVVALPTALTTHYHKTYVNNNNILLNLFFSLSL